VSRILKAGWINARNVRGSATFVVVATKQNSDQIQIGERAPEMFVCVHADCCAANLGDSGLIIIRDSKVVFRTEPQQRNFNQPYQLGTVDMADTPDDAELTDFKVVLGDVIIVGEKERDELCVCL
jgi:serine/threonine protein phosphatase PrpC